MKQAEQFYIENSYKDLPTLFVVETSDTMLINYYREKFQIDFPFVWDVNNEIVKRIPHIGNSSYILINDTGQSILDGDFFNDKTLKKEYLRIIKYHLINNEN